MLPVPLFSLSEDLHALETSVKTEGIRPLALGQEWNGVSSTLIGGFFFFFPTPF